jgi:hypothetical protein
MDILYRIYQLPSGKWVLVMFGAAKTASRAYSTVQAAIALLPKEHRT